MFQQYIKGSADPISKDIDRLTEDEQIQLLGLYPTFLKYLKVCGEEPRQFNPTTLLSIYGKFKAGELDLNDYRHIPTMTDAAKILHIDLQDEVKENDRTRNED